MQHRGTVEAKELGIKEGMALWRRTSWGQGGHGTVEAKELEIKEGMALWR